MGKINQKMRNSRASITNEPEVISQDGTMSVEHHHEWQFATESTYYNKFGDYVGVKSKFACECGGIKKILQFEVED